jgi:hypothetical protein
MTVATAKEPDIYLRELCLSANPATNSFVGQHWTKGDQGKATFDRDVGQEKIHPHSPLSAKAHSGKIKVFYRPAAGDVLKVAWNDPNANVLTSNKVWYTREANASWPS